MLTLSSSAMRRSLLSTTLSQDRSTGLEEWGDHRTYDSRGLIMEHPHIQGLSEWKPLARGRLAVVWEARQLSLDRKVAVEGVPPRAR